MQRNMLQFVLGAMGRGMANSRGTAAKVQHFTELLGGPVVEGPLGPDWVYERLFTDFVKEMAEPASWEGMSECKVRAVLSRPGYESWNSWLVVMARLCTRMRGDRPVLDPWDMLNSVKWWAQEDKWFVPTMPDALRVAHKVNGALLGEEHDWLRELNAADEASIHRAVHVMIMLRQWGHGSVAGHPPVYGPPDRLGWENRARYGAAWALSTLLCLQFEWLRPEDGEATGMAALIQDAAIREHWLERMVDLALHIPVLADTTWQEHLRRLQETAGCMPVWSAELQDRARAALLSQVPYPVVFHSVAPSDNHYEWWEEPRAAHTIYWATVWVICGMPMPTPDEWEALAWQRPPNGSALAASRHNAQQLAMKVLGDLYGLPAWQGNPGDMEAELVILEEVLLWLHLPIKGRRQYRGEAEEATRSRGEWLLDWRSPPQSDRASQRVARQEASTHWRAIIHDCAVGYTVQGVQRWYEASTWERGVLVRIGDSPMRRQPRSMMESLWIP